jgi:hypothetical protein
MNIFKKKKKYVLFPATAIVEYLDLIDIGESIEYKNLSKCKTC